jgi:hypothetical protein
MKKTESKNSRDTVPLITLRDFPLNWYIWVREHIYLYHLQIFLPLRLLKHQLVYSSVYLSVYT